jgi:hypothetical protein
VSGDHYRPPSGIPARNYTWPPAEAGNALALKHGGRSTLHIAPRAAEIAELVEPSVPGATPADRIAIALLGTALARVEAYSLALEQRGELPLDFDGRDRLSGELHRWSKHCVQLLTVLALTPASRAAMGRDVVEARVALREHLQSKYGVDFSDDA